MISHRRGIGDECDAQKFGGCECERRIGLMMRSIKMTAKTVNEK
jgi:hypothetical protein